MFDTLVSVSFGEDDGVRVIENMLEMTRQLAQQDLAALSSAACKRQTVLVAQLLSALEVVQGDQLVELDRRGVTDAEDGHKTANWLAHVTQTPKSAAKRRLNVATCLNQNFGLVRQSILDGKLSWDHAAALQRATNNRNVDRLTRVQDVLIEISDACTSYETWARQISWVGKTADEDGPSTHQQMCENNYLRFFNEFNGSYRVDGRLSNEYVEIVKQAIDRESQSLFNTYAADREVDDSITIPPLPTLQALALVDIVRRSNGAPNAPFRPLAERCATTRQASFARLRAAR